MVDAASPLQLIAYRCAEACGFGSAATGDLAAANDLDLLVVVPELSSRYNEMVRLQKTLRGILMSVDLVVTSQASYNNRCQIPGKLPCVIDFETRISGRCGKNKALRTK